MKPDRRSSRLLYRIRYRTGEYLLRALVASLGRLPASARPCIAWITDRVTYLLLRGYRERMHDALQRTMSEELPTHAERHAVVRAAWRNFAYALVETFTTLFMKRDELCARIEIKGEERLRKALARNKGVIALSGHFGNFIMIGPRLVAQGYDFSVVIKLPQEERFASLQNGYCARAGVKVIPARPRHQSVARIIAALRRNEIVLVIPDEFKTTGVEVSFLGHRVPAPKGPSPSLNGPAPRCCRSSWSGMRRTGSRCTSSPRSGSFRPRTTKRTCASTPAGSSGKSRRWCANTRTSGAGWGSGNPARGRLPTPRRDGAGKRRMRNRMEHAWILA